uniref:DNA 3'-5' helicase n=1 Tax=Ditylum brightwellii TaxID=49249 RepID=A0A7S1ZVZ9_9STRA
MGGRGDANLRPITILNAVSQLKADERIATLFPNQKPDENTRKLSKKLLQIASQILPLYRTSLYTQNTLDFDDLIFFTTELLATSSQIRLNLQKRWNHVLVDEFQDTSATQLELVKLWTDESLFVVGDANQSIYSWRGANVGSMEDFVREFEGVESVFLMENYRSTSNIISAAQKIISASKSSSLKEEARKDASMKPMRGSGPTPRVLACSDAKAEASFVVKTVQEMTDNGDLTPQSTVAILYRTNAQSRAIEEACVSENLRYVIKGSAGTFYSRAEVKDCLCFLKVLYNGRDRNAFVRAVKTPSRGIGEVALNEFFAYYEALDSKVTLLDALISLADEVTDDGDDIESGSERKLTSSSVVSPQDFMSKRAINRFIPFAIQMKKIKHQSYVQTVSGLLTTIMTDLDLRSHFDSISKTSDEFAERLSNAMELCAAAERYADDGPCLVHPSMVSDKSDDGTTNEISVSESPLGNFLDDVSLLVDADGAQNNDDEGTGRLVAQLMTIHASKGMEFDAVFLIGNEEGTFPTQRALVEGDGSVELEEERRLCYVAMTRAKTNLVLTWRREVMTFFGQSFKVKDTDRSRFLDTLVAKKGKKTKKMIKTKKTKKTNLSRDSQDLKSDLTLEQRRRQLQSKMTSSKDRGAPKSPQGGSWDEWKPGAASTGMRSNTNSERRPKQELVQKRDRMERLNTAQPTAKRQIKKSLLSSSSPRTMSPQRGSWGEWKPSTDDGAQNIASRLKKQQQQPQQVRIQQRRDNNRQYPTATTRQRSTQYQNQAKTRTARAPPPPACQSNGISFDSFLETSNSQSNGNTVPEIDSTMFFAVGSTIQHNIHGRGTVLPPPKEDNMRVRIRFENDMELDFPASGSGLRRIY